MRALAIFFAVAVLVVGCHDSITAPPPPPAASVPQPLVIAGKTIAETYSAKCIRIIDGDTIEIVLDDATIEDRTPNIRLESIDTPETGSKNIPGQPFANEAREAVKSLCVGKVVQVHQTKVDRFGRPLAFIEVDGVNVNAELIRRGLAWHFKRYSDSDELAELEAAARDAKRGLWIDPEPLPPWEWRSKN